MAGLQQLKNQLKSVKLTAQLTGAMETAASAKFSKLSTMLSLYKNYSNEIEKLRPYCSLMNLQMNEDSGKAKDCYIVMGYNRGLCGSYNSELHSFSEKILADKKDALLFVSGKKAISHFEAKGYTFEQVILSDTPESSDCAFLLEKIRLLISTGEIKSLTVIYQKYINTMSQVPKAEIIFPYEAEDVEKPCDEVLFLPDKKTIEKEFYETVIETLLYKRILEAALGAQAATLIAMHTAVDHANESISELENTIHKKRQSVITSDVIETTAAASPQEVN